MTRNATKLGRKRIPLEATPWSEMQSSNAARRSKDSEIKLVGKSTGKVKKKASSKKLMKKLPTSQMSQIALDSSNVAASTTSGGKNTQVKKKILVEAKSSKASKKIEKVKEMKAVRKLEARKIKSEARRLKRVDLRNSDKLCFQCRKRGHLLSDCPLAKNKDSEGTGVCFKCGSTGHTSKACKVKSQGRYPYATCFVCKEVGHISKDCPKNERGLYPNGGCCLECGSVRHFRRDCPEYQRKQGVTNYTLDTWAGNKSADADSMRDDYLVSRSNAHERAKVKKVVNKRKTKYTFVTMK